MCIEEDLRKFLTIKKEMETITGEIKKDDIYIKVNEKTLGGYRNVLEQMGEGIAFCSTDVGYLTYMGSNWYVTLGLPKTNHSNTWSPKELKEFLEEEQRNKSVQHPVGPENCFKPAYEIHLNQFWSMELERMQPGQKISITEDQFKIIELFANTRKDENLNTIYILNDAHFRILPKFVYEQARGVLYSGEVISREFDV